MDFRRRLTDRLIECLESASGALWDQGWSKSGPIRPVRPFNPYTGRRYRGGNVLNLLDQQAALGSDDPRWMTLKQANEAGYTVRKGAKATYVEYWDWGHTKPPKTKEIEEQQAFTSPDDLPINVDVEDEPPVRKRPRVFYAAVFNGADIVGLPELASSTRFEAHALAEQLIVATQAKLKHDARVKSAFYSPPDDFIGLPPRNAFHTAGDYYATVLHELAHWTGHETRLARQLTPHSLGANTPEYAKEELRAEIASMFLCGSLGVEGQIQNHANYVVHWLEILRGDKHEIFRAAKEADRIVDFILDLAPEIRDVIDAEMTANLLPRHEGKGVRAPVSSGSPETPTKPSEPVRDPTLSGMSDPRWAAFVAAIKSRISREVDVESRVLEQAFEVFAPTFTEFMDRTERDGVPVARVYKNISEALVGELIYAQELEKRWQSICTQIRSVGQELNASGEVDAALEKLGGRYAELIRQGVQEGSKLCRTYLEVESMLFGGESGPSLEYVKSLIGHAEPSFDDDFELTLLGVSDHGVEELQMS